MAEYRLFRFDPVSGLASEEVLNAANDDQARQLMIVRAAGADCELWFGERLIAFIARAEGR